MEPTTTVSRSTPRVARTRRRCCTTRCPPPSGPHVWGRIATRPSSTGWHCASTPHRDSGRSRLCAALSYECYLTNQVEEAHEARRESLELADDPLVIGDAERWLSRLAWYLGRNDESETYAERAIRTLEGLGETRELAMAYSNLSQLRMLAFDNAEAVAWARRAIDLARRVGDHDTEIHALNNIGSALALTGDFMEGITRLEQSRDLALAVDAHEHVARAYTNLGSSLVTIRRLRRPSAT